MMIGANFPDIDILSAPFGRATEFRRGWTHGVLALVVLPFVLTGLMMLWDRYRRRGETPAIPRQLLLLSAISIWTHPTLDWMNSYGLRWLMPFDGTWFYGDSLFIVDPYLLVILGTGVWLSRKREREDAPHPWKPARIAVALSTLYVIGMLTAQEIAENAAQARLADTSIAREKLVVTASPGNPLKWRVHADNGRTYSEGRVNVLTQDLQMDPGGLEKGLDNPVVLSAIKDESAAAFLDWARLPFYRIEQTGSGTAVRVTDARYGASILIPVLPQRPRG
jgi:inner membrane protein